MMEWIASGFTILIAIFYCAKSINYLTKQIEQINDRLFAQLLFRITHLNKKGNKRVAFLLLSCLENNRLRQSIIPS